MDPCNRPHTGVGVIIFNSEGNLLIGKRKKAPGIGKWAPPGGKLEHGESVAGCARREVLEETGIILNEVTELLYTNEVDEDGHHITLYAIAEYEGPEPTNKEPDKCEGWEWLDPENLPDDTWQPVKNLINKLKKMAGR